MNRYMKYLLTGVALISLGSGAEQAAGFGVPKIVKSGIGEAEKKAPAVIRGVGGFDQFDPNIQRILKNHFPGASYTKAEKIKLGRAMQESVKDLSKKRSAAIMKLFDTVMGKIKSENVYIVPVMPETINEVMGALKQIPPKDVSRTIRALEEAPAGERRRLLTLGVDVAKENRITLTKIIQNLVKGIKVVK